MGTQREKRAHPIAAPTMNKNFRLRGIAEPLIERAYIGRGQVCFARDGQRGIRQVSSGCDEWLIETMVFGRRTQIDDALETLRRESKHLLL